MIIVFNVIGAGTLILAGAIGALSGLLFHDKTGAISVVAVGLVAVVLDVLYRMKKGGGSLLHPRRGGHACFIPAWIIGAGFLVCGAFGFTSWIHELPATSQSAQGAQPVTTSLASGPQPKHQAGPAAATAPAQISNTGLKLKMISGTGQHGLALINGENFAVGETHTLKLAPKNVTVTCLEIHEQSVLAKVQGESQPRELKLGETKSPAAQ